MSTSTLQDLFDSSIHDHMMHLSGCFSITRTEEMCSLNPSSYSHWSRSHTLSKIAGKYAFADVNRFAIFHFLSEVLSNQATLAGQYCAPQQWLVLS